MHKAKTTLSVVLMFVILLSTSCISPESWPRDRALQKKMNQGELWIRLKNTFYSQLTYTLVAEKKVGVSLVKLHPSGAYSSSVGDNDLGMVYFIPKIGALFDITIN